MNIHISPKKTVRYPSPQRKQFTSSTCQLPERATTDHRGPFGHPRCQVLHFPPVPSPRKKFEISKQQDILRTIHWPSPRWRTLWGVRAPWIFGIKQLVLVNLDLDCRLLWHYLANATSLIMTILRFACCMKSLSWCQSLIRNPSRLAYNKILDKKGRAGFYLNLENAHCLFLPCCHFLLPLQHLSLGIHFADGPAQKQK